jgi:hypothetical protein
MTRAIREIADVGAAHADFVARRGDIIRIGNALRGGSLSSKDFTGENDEPPERSTKVIYLPRLYVKVDRNGFHAPAIGQEVNSLGKEHIYLNAVSRSAGRIGREGSDVTRRHVFVFVRAKEGLPARFYRSDDVSRE